MIGLNQIAPYLVNSAVYSSEHIADYSYQAVIPYLLTYKICW